LQKQVSYNFKTKIITVNALATTAITSRVIVPAEGPSPGTFGGSAGFFLTTIFDPSFTVGLLSTRILLISPF
jgi:hypothetical protein